MMLELGVDGLHFHDLRHTGNVLAAASGVSTRDLMTRMGHDSMTAALIYQHASTQADQAIAASMDARFEALQADAGRESQKPAERESSKRSRQSQWARMARGASGEQSRGGQDWNSDLLTWRNFPERVTRIELALSAWEADVLPLNYTRAPPRLAGRAI